MLVKTPEQLEDAAIADAIRAIVGLKVKATQRELVNGITEKVKLQVDLARLNGKKVDVHKFVQEVLDEIANT